MIKNTPYDVYNNIKKYNMGRIGEIFKYFSRNLVQRALEKNVQSLLPDVGIDAKEIVKSMLESKLG